MPPSAVTRVLGFLHGEPPTALTDDSLPKTATVAFETMHVYAYVNSTRLACRNMLHGEAGDVAAMKPTVDDHCGCRWRRGQGMSPMTRLTVMAVTMGTLAGAVMRLDADFGEATPVGRSLMTKLPARLEL